MAFLPFHIAEIWKRCPFRVKPPRIGFYGVSPGGKFSFSDQNSVSKTYGGPFFLGGSIMGFPLRTWRTFFTYSSTSPLGTPVSSRAATHINVLCIMALLALSLASLGANIICASRLTSSASITAWTWQDKFAHQRHTRNKWTARLSPSPSPPLFSPRNDVWGTRGEFLYWWRRASDWLMQISLAALPIRGTTQIWVVTRHHYGISLLVSHFPGKPVLASRNVGCFLRLLVRALWLAERSVCMRVCKTWLWREMFCFSRANHASTKLKTF